MYWFRSSNLMDALFLLAFILLIWFGGWMLARHSFRLLSRERLFVGFGLGIGLFVAAANILGRFLPPEIVFWVASILIAVLGFWVGLRASDKMFDREDFKIGKQISLFLVLTFLVMVIGRGLGIFDDRKNLSIISTMAAGDIPPHFYMNSTFRFAYHYGFQLFGASLMRVGGLFPWSAFDLAKGLVAALVLNLTLLWGWRRSQRFWGGFLLMLWVAFASGTRWLLLFLPPSMIQRFSSSMVLWGSGSESASNLLASLSAPWIIEGGPPGAIPFAFINGIMQPFVLVAQAGPKSLALAMMLLVLFLFRRRKNLLSSVVILFILGTWALAAEAEFILFLLGMFLAALLLRVWRKDKVWRGEFRSALPLFGAAGFLSVFQGGTITQFVQAMLGKLIGASTSTAMVSEGFTLRFPPAIVSSHLGEMHLLNPGELFIAMLELGPILLLLPIVIWTAFRWSRKGDYLRVGLVISAVAGLILPLWLEYSVDRDITRLMNFSLYVLLLLGWDWMIRIRRAASREWIRNASITIIASSSFAGVIVLGVLMTAMQRAVFADEIAPLDAMMTRMFWDELPENTEILDSSSWRAVAITGRLTRSAYTSNSFMPSWDSLRANPLANEVAANGFEYVYIDKTWWDAMPEIARESYFASCVWLVGESFDNASNGARWLYDVSRCSP